MIIEGYFYTDEIASATAVGAEIRKLEFGRVAILFETSQIYDRWVSDQSQLHPERWTHCIRLKKSEPTVHS